MNQVILIGRLARDPELSYTPNSTAVCKFTLAVPRIKGDEADFIRVTVFGKQAETTDRYMSRGRKCAIMGRIQTGSYPKDGKTVYTTDVIAERVEFLDRAPTEAGRPQLENVPDEELDETGFMSDEVVIPF